VSIASRIASRISARSQKIGKTVTIRRVVQNYVVATGKTSVVSTTDISGKAMITTKSKSNPSGMNPEETLRFFLPKHTSITFDPAVGDIVVIGTDMSVGPFYRIVRSIPKNVGEDNYGFLILCGNV